MSAKQDLSICSFLTALKKMGDDFVASYIKIAEGEKDPRNLLLGFSIMRVILIEFDPYLHLEVCYGSTNSRCETLTLLFLATRICSILCFAISRLLSARLRTILTESHLMT